MATLPVGEDKWLDYVTENSRHANDLEKRVHVIELFKLAVEAEPNSVRVWRAYCDYFWSLYIASQSYESGWSDEERHMGCELFSLNAALSLWQQAYEAIQYRISDSHELWDQWISLESGLLARSRTAEGIRRITYLYTDRLQVPHVTRDNTAQAFSEFLSTYNKAAWEETMQSITANPKSQEAKKLTEDRDMFELKLKEASREGKDEVYRNLLKEYLEWECAQSKRSNKQAEATGDLCRGLYARALTGVFAFDDTIWNEYVRFLSTSGTYAQSPQGMVDVLRRAVDHCPWSGAIWSRYILTAEDAKLPFNEIEQIKHKATSNPELYKNGMAALLDMYAGWCGFLKRKAMDLNATDEDVDIADMGLRAALEFVDQAKHRYGDSYRGDPNFRLERIYIQYLTEKKRNVDEARSEWHKLAEKQLYADSYDFWLNYYLWEMMIFASNGKDRSPTPSTAAIGLRVPSVATAVLGRAIKRKSLDWPERVIDVYVQHCNDYELPSTVRIAIDTVYETRKEVTKRREREAAQAAEYYAAQAQEQQAAHAAQTVDADSTSSSKRKREEEADAADVTSSKRPKSEVAEADTALKQQSLKRDRENTSVLVSNIPAETTKTKIRQYFKEYGHIVDVTDPAIDPQDNTQTVMVEFRTPEEAQSALLRDGKYFGTAQISVQPGTDLTVYVTNYPPTADKAYIGNLFKDCGEILGIRMPSLKGNVRRRFSYVTFRDRSASSKATQKHGTVLEGKFKLMAMYSDPTRAKKREGAIEEGRELHITNLDPSAVEDDVQKAFSKYGTVKRISIPRNKAGKGHGAAYVEMETREQARTAASELDKAKLRSSIMTVQISTPSNFKRTAAVSKEGASPAPSRDEEGDEMMADSNGDGVARQAGPSRAEIASRTIALLGIPDTVNDARVKEIVDKVGGFKSLILQPSHGGAKIEFEDEPSAGRAMLQLDGYILDGRKLRTGSVEKLKHSKGEIRTEKIVYGVGGKKQADKRAASKNTDSGAPFVPPSTTIKRPVLGNKGGAKRGLGFMTKAVSAGGSRQGEAAASQPEAKVNGATGGGETEAMKPMKSNADFKALLLGGTITAAAAAGAATPAAATTTTTNTSKEEGVGRNGNGQAGQGHN
ncbi:RNA recognition domain-containing protein [Colletotrichum higginsianum IMI 349063]|uniref:RNA recognition domain-containing protein n=2 Tax=Colletotrichum higginsianum (strain IMI 349063) TaxID=759273 RepID=A0A1B7Y7F5_COLHI|nr:RNA recognition domain-containing protein [Colletotrichum higginsianum IMI 349063]OBR07917.1 RNA recognition domain-containing protein [Colletotrichum higginsianum IMI 349063]